MNFIELNENLEVIEIDYIGVEVVNDVNDVFNSLGIERVI